MSLRLWYRDPPGFGAWTELNLVTGHAVDFKLSVSYSHPAALSWTILEAQHTTPIPYLADICFVDTDFYDPSPLTDPELFTDPIFEGHVKEILPAGSNELAYVAMDPTDRAGQDLIIRFGTSALIPRLVYNAMIEQDDDYAFSRDLTATVETMIKDILGDRTDELRGLIAAPAASTPYVVADLSSLDLVPQEKIVFETEGLRAGLDRLLAWYPQYRILFNPGGSGGRQWRFRKVTEAPATTLTLNDWSTVGGKRVLSLSLQRSIEQRVAAVKILGPLKLQSGKAFIELSTATAPAGTTHGLIALWDGGDQTTVLADGPNVEHETLGRVFRILQIEEADARALSSILPISNIAGFSDVGRGGKTDDQWKLTREPTLLATYDGGATFETVGGIEIDRANGIVRAPRTVIRHNGTSWEGPDGFAFYFGYFSSVLSARAPALGFEGTANSVLGITTELERFDESFVVGYSKNDAFVGEVERTMQFTKMAQNILDAQKDIVYAGGCSLKGINYDWLRLNKRVNLTAVDGNGDALTTGWEAINTIVTDVEYDYSSKLTTLTFSGDHLEFLLTDPELLKQRLKIEALDTGLRFIIEATLNGQLLFRSAQIRASDLQGGGGIRQADPIREI